MAHLLIVMQITRHVATKAKNKSKSKSKLAGPKAAPLGRKQMEFKIFDHLLCKVKNTKSRFINIQCSRPAASTIQLSKPFQIEYFCSAVSQV